MKESEDQSPLRRQAHILCEPQRQARRYVNAPRNQSQYSVTVGVICEWEPLKFNYPTEGAR